MENTLSVKELRINLPGILKKLRAGKSFTLIYHSKPVGQLVPFAETNDRKLGIIDLILSGATKLRARKTAVQLVREDRDK